VRGLTSESDAASNGLRGKGALFVADKPGPFYTFDKWMVTVGRDSRPKQDPRGWRYNEPGALCQKVTICVGDAEIVRKGGLPPEFIIFDSKWYPVNVVVTRLILIPQDESMWPSTRYNWEPVNRYRDHAAQEERIEIPTTPILIHRTEDEPAPNWDNGPTPDPPELPGGYPRLT
jgi:hypothetical protein